MDCPPGPLPELNSESTTEKIKERTYHGRKTHQGPPLLTPVVRGFDEPF